MTIYYKRTSLSDPLHVEEVSFLWNDGFIKNKNMGGCSPPISSSPTFSPSAYFFLFSFLSSALIRTLVIYSGSKRDVKALNEHFLLSCSKYNFPF
jgi:hypothetical protein